MTGTSGPAGSPRATGWLIAVSLLTVVGVILLFIEPLAAIVVFVVLLGVAVWLTRPRPSPMGLEPWTALVVTAGSAAGIAWLLTRFALGTLGSRTDPPPESVTNPLDPAQRGAVLAYARGLTYADTVCESHTQHDSANEYHGQCDFAIVDTLGTIAIVSPEVNIHRSHGADLRRGRVQLRIEIRLARPDLDSLRVYESLGVPPGVSYLWVDSLTSTAEGSTARAVVVPANGSLPARAKPVRLYQGTTWNQAVARWTPGQCWTCKGSEWCSSPT